MGSVILYHHWSDARNLGREGGHVLVPNSDKRAPIFLGGRFGEVRHRAINIASHEVLLHGDPSTLGKNVPTNRLWRKSVEEKFWSDFNGGSAKQGADLNPNDERNPNSRNPKERGGSWRS